MKKMKKLLSLALACVMVMSLVTVSSADENENNADRTYVEVTYDKTNNVSFDDGTITIDGIHEDVHHPGESDPNHTQYDVYKMLHLESYNKDSEAYSYRVVKEWVEFFQTGDGKDYITLDDKGYATWTNPSQSDEVKATFAQLALAYAKSKNIQPVMTTNTPYSDAGGQKTGFQKTGDQGTFYGLTLGYYLLDSNVGVLCGLTTTNPNAEVVAKNGTPTIEKSVKEDSTNEYGSTNTAEVGQLVEFRVKVKVHAGAQNYILHDEMDEALDFVEVQSVVHENPDDGTLSLGDLKNSDASSRDYYTVNTTGISDDCDFEIVFTDKFCNALQDNDYFYVFYTARLNANAVQHVSENVTHLTYGENSIHTTTDAKTETYTYGFDLLKTDSNNNLLGGATDELCAIFEIYTNDQVTVDHTGGTTTYTYDTPLKFVKLTNANGNIIYRPLAFGETGSVDESVVTNGRVRIAGLDNGIYYLREIQAPPGGYNMLTDPVKITISDGNQYANYDASGNYTGTGIGVQVVNSTGSILPSTGGFGTTMFITCGSVLVLACGLLLVTKKRMTMIQD